MSILNPDKPSLSRKPPESQVKRIRFLKRTMVEKNGIGIKPWRGVSRARHRFGPSLKVVSVLVAESFGSASGIGSRVVSVLVCVSFRSFQTQPSAQEETSCPAPQKSS